MPKLLNNNSKVVSNSKALSDIAKNQQTDAIESVEQLQQFAEQLEKDVAKFKQALILLSSPNSIGLSTAENIHLSPMPRLTMWQAIALTSAPKTTSSPMPRTRSASLRHKVDQTGGGQRQRLNYRPRMTDWMRSHVRAFRLPRRKTAFTSG
jgi:hypothetical protein